MVDKVTISFELPRQRMRDILTTAVESGIGYWVSDGDFKSIDVDRDASGSVERIYLSKHTGKGPKFAPGVSVIGQTTKRPTGRAVLDDAELARAFSRALAVDDDANFVNPSAGYAAIAELNGRFDASTADALVQFALFGEVIYG